ncbi:hypothetical protein P9853_15485, partial [Geobacillus stearothermophilus]|uniref:hypothetical protein n=1 Tax=Geobacillus stearothermophilus TaxID=1422 RepID=UPI002E201CAE|nr:hypothetical protein [Geobacillus stearothermophilus]
MRTSRRPSERVRRRLFFALPHAVRLAAKKEEGGRPRLLSPFRLRQAEPAFDAIEAAFHPVEPAVEPFD